MQLLLTILAAAACVVLFQPAISLSQTSRVNLGINALVSGASTLQATNPSYLAQFPLPERIKTDVSGVDAMETAAKHASIFWQLRELIYNLALSQRRTDRQFTPDERRLEVEYRNARHRAVQPFGEPDYRNPKWFEVYTRYQNDLWLRDEVFKKYFTPELRRAIYVALKGQMPTQNAPEQSRLTPPAGSSTAGAANRGEAVQVGPKTTSKPSNAGYRVSDYLAQAKQYLHQQDYAKAIDAYKKAIALEPSPSAYNNLANIYFEMKQYPDALAAYQQAIHLLPNDATLRINLAGTYIQMEQYENAISACREAMRLKPDSDLPLSAMGRAYYRLEQFPEAAVAFQQAIRFKPNDVAALLNLGRTYVDMRRKEEALQVYEKLQKIDPTKAKELKFEIKGYLDSDEPVFLTSLGLVFEDEKQHQDALRAYRHAIVLKPKLDELIIIHSRRGFTYLELKKYDKAVNEFREVIRLNPRERMAHLYLGKSYLAIGQKDLALQVYRTLRRLDPRTALELYAEINK